MLSSLPNRPLMPTELESLNEKGRFLPALSFSTADVPGVADDVGECYVGCVYLGEEQAVSLGYDVETESWQVVERKSLDASADDMLQRVQEWFEGGR